MHASMKGGGGRTKAMDGKPPTGPVDIARSLDEGGWNGFQKWVLVFAALALAMDGVANQSLGLAVPALVKAWGVARSDFAFVSALNLVGVAVGTVIGGVMGDRLGRRAGLIFSLVVFGVATATGAMTSTPGELAALRFIDGLGIGGAIPNSAALITEFTPIRRRSVAIATTMAFIPVGGLLAGSLGAAVLPTMGWEALFLICGAAPLVLAAVFLVALPESPRFLLRRPDRKPELIKLLGRFGYGFSSDQTFTEEARAGRTPVTAVLGADIRRDTFCLWAGFFFCLMSSYTLFSWVPAMLSSLGMSLRNASLGITAFHLGGVIGSIVSGFVIQQMGSRPAAMAVGGGGVLAALTLGIMLSQGALIVVVMLPVLIALGFFIAGIHNAVYTLAAHIYPPFVRSTGVGAASAVGRLGAILSSFTGIITMESAGALGFFGAVAVLLGLSAIGILAMRRQMPRSAELTPAHA
jgi:AAHS family 4-hydroxybenzoate transporter-like MFS transporter